MIPKLAAILIFAVTAADAATLVSVTEYRVRRGESEFVVRADGERARADLPDRGSNLLYDSLLSSGGEIVALNLRLRTWFELETPAPLGLESRYLTPLTGAARNVRWEIRETTGEERREYEGDLSYEVRGRMGGAAVAVRISAKMRVVTDPRIDSARWIGRRLPVTGYPAVDEKLDASEALLAGLPLEMSLEVTRAYVGGDPMTDALTVTTSEIRKAEINASTFARPETFRHQPPIRTRPGL